MSANAHTSEGHGHITPVPVYIAIFGILMVLTVLTVLVSYMGLGKASIYVAMAVALVKATLVAGWFMHLKYDSKFNVLIFALSILFMLIFFTITMSDLAYRNLIIPETDNHTVRHEEEAKAKETKRLEVEALKNAPPASAPAAAPAPAPASH